MPLAATASEDRERASGHGRLLSRRAGGEERRGRPVARVRWTGSRPACAPGTEISVRVVDGRCRRRASYGPKRRDLEGARRCLLGCLIS
ncbi:hypothetical protein DAI22_01g053208 [Oryza sativa Japonica Group]|nr:hypothetical protein DAI22_01g053208 [Oryza sativa Japonica Group]